MIKNKSAVETKEAGPEKKKFSLLFFWRHPGIALLLALLFFAFFIPPEEYRFMKAAERLFQESGQDSILIKDIADFEWDKVCFIGQYTSLRDLGSEIDKKILEGENRFHEHWPFFSGAFWFVFDDKIVEKYSYYTWGIQITKNGFEEMHLNIKGKHYSYLPEHAFKGNRCKNRNEAAFSRVTQGTGRMEGRLILFTSRKGI